jgi:Tfp pilus assembly protein PilF
LRIETSRWAWLLVLAVAVVPHLNGLGGGFHYDDEHALVRNTHLRQLSAIPGFFLDSATFSAEPDMAMYRPLLQTTFALNYALTGYDAWSWHLVSILLHGLAAAAVLALFRHLVPAGVALAAALLFAVHPVHSQAVNYLSSRSETMCMALVLWALVLLQTRRIGWSVFLYGAALLTKSAAVALLPVAALLQWRQAAGQRRWRELLPHVGITFLYVTLVSVEGFLPRSLSQDVRPYAEQIWTQTKALVYYMQLTVVPLGLSVEHDFAVSGGFWDPPVLLAGLVLASGLWLYRSALRGQVSRFGLGSLWFIAALGVPFLVPLNVLINEHRLYLPLAGFALAVNSPRLMRSLPRLLPVAICAVLGCLTILQNQLWQNELTLWTSAAKKAPNSFRSWSNLALAYHADGRRDSAESAYRRALHLHPGHARAWNNLGLLLEESARPEEARSAYGESVRLSSVFSGPLTNLGRLALATGDVEAAELALTAALERNRLDVDAILHRGRLLQIQGAADSAQHLYERVLELDPASAAAANNLGLLRVEEGEREAGRGWLHRALGADPDYEGAAVNLMLLDLEDEGVTSQDAYRRVLDRYPGRAEVGFDLGNLLARAGEWEEAVTVYETAVAAGTYVPGLHAALATACHVVGRREQALASFRLAARESPQDVRIWNGLAAAAAASGQLGQARQASARALELDPDNHRARANLDRLNGSVIEAAGTWGKDGK